MNRRWLGVAVVGLALALPAQAAAKTKSPPVDLSNADHCDFIGQQQGSLCLLPFPDDYYAVPDAGTATGLRINLKTEATPPNVAGQRVDTAPYNLNDGFSPGQTIVVKVPGLNSIAAMQRTGAVPINHIGEYARPDQPIVVIDATTGERWPIWSEIDSNATDPDRAALLIHPAVNFAAKHRYIVALRDLRTAGGQEIPAPNGFLYYRDKLRSEAAVINQRRHHFKSIFKTLQKAHIKRKDLYLAWDFTVSSDQNIAARMLHIRDDAFAQLGDTNLADLAVAGAAPQFSVSSVQNITAAQSPNVARLVQGTFTVPCYLRPDCAPGGTFQLDSNGLPTRNGNWTANFVCIIPRAAIDPGARPSRPSLYGHGLLASALDVTFINQQTLAQLADITFCATDEIGLSTADFPTAISFLQNLSNFPKLGDRSQQGLLDELFLGRLMIHPDGFLSNGAFHVDGTTGSPGVIDPTPPLLQRQQPRRRPRRSTDRGGPRLHPRFARGAGDELLGVVQPPPNDRHGSLPAGPRSCLPRQAHPAARPLADPDALGSLRPQWLRAPDDNRSPAQHPAAQGAAGRCLRRSPGHAPGKRTWRRGRSAPPRTHRSSIPAAGRASTSSGASRGSAATRSVARRSSTGTSARSARIRTIR